MMHLKRKSMSSGNTDSPKKARTANGTSLKRHYSFGDTPTEVNEGFLLDETYIADGSRPYSLPTVPGKHMGLKSITPDTLKDVMHGRYDDVISGYRIIDCRYPYEFEGGHVQGAENRFTKDMIDEVLKEALVNDQTENQIIVFHCEFSSKRGPKLCKYLRNKDRELNGHNYPKLIFPEIYLLEGGYKDFYNTHMDLCEPRAYVPMLHQKYTEEVCYYRARTSDTRKTCCRTSGHVGAPQKLIFASC